MFQNEPARCAKLSVCLLAAVSGLALGTASAQAAERQAEPASAEIGEVVVTAQKRSTELQKTPIAITVLDGETLEARGQTRLMDVAASVPNFQFNAGDRSTNNQTSMRGITSLWNAEQQSVGTYVDGIYIGGRGASNGDLIDIDHIEVLRGPQGTLFGKNTIAGAISIITRKPTNTPEGQVIASVGNYRDFGLRATAGGPIVRDSLYFQVGAAHAGHDGYQDNPLGPDGFSSRSNGGRARLLFDQGKGFSADLVGDYSEDYARSAAGMTDIHGPMAGSPNRDNLERRRLGGAALTLKYDLGAVELRSITGYRARRQAELSDFDGGQAETGHYIGATRQQALSQEVQVASTGERNFDWVAGVFYSTEWQKDVTTFCVAAGPSLACADAYTRYNWRSKAIFGQGTYHFGNGFHLTLGERYSHEVVGVTNVNGAGLEFVFLPGTLASRPTFENFSGRATLSYDLRPGASVYGSISQGFRAGGTNLGLIVNGLSNPTYGSERSLNYEAGLKTYLMDRKVRLNAAAFYIEYKDIQVSVAVPGVDYAFYTTNAGAARSYGLEVELLANLTRELSINGSFGWTHATYKTFKSCGGFGVDCDGNRLPNAAKLTATLGVQWRRPLTDDLELTLNGNAAHTGDTTFDIQARPALARDPHTLLDAQVGIESLAGRWSVSVYGRNLTDKRYFTNASQINNSVTYTPGAPRTYGVRATKRF